MVIKNNKVQPPPEAEKISPDAKNINLKVMLIEDNEDFSELLVMAFDSQNSIHNIEVFTSGEDALKELQSGNYYDVIVTDYLLPGINGVEFLQTLEKMGIDIPTVVLTGQGSEKIAVEALKMGASDYLVKDISSFQILPTVLERVYRQKQVEKRNLELQKKIVQQNQELAEINRNLMLYSKELIKAEKMASLLFFVRGISHELNNPLAGIVGFSELLLNKVPPEDPIRDDLEEIRSCGYRVKEIVSKLARFCGKEKQKSRNIKVHEMISEVLGFFMPQADKAKIEVSLDYSEENPVIEGISVDIQQALMALLINALEAMPTGGKITISTRIFEDSVEISITDTGEGIQEENLDKVFSPFFSDNKGDKTMGLGLAVAYGIVNENSGKIKIRSTLGVGTTFTIVLPKVEEN